MSYLEWEDAKAWKSLMTKVKQLAMERSGTYHRRWTDKCVGRHTTKFTYINTASIWTEAAEECGVVHWKVTYDHGITSIRFYSNGGMVDGYRNS